MERYAMLRTAVLVYLRYDSTYVRYTRILEYSGTDR
jgi:hypothetical protein